jgi:hypothetical protein
MLLIDKAGIITPNDRIESLSLVRESAGKSRAIAFSEML